MDVDILPCPFCGNELKRTTQKINQTARCVTDGCIGVRMPSIILESSQDVAAWNTRHIPEGYALVPVEPTDAMVNVNPRILHPKIAKEIYQAMIAVAQAQQE